MIKVHHLKFSRSTRVIWLMEELGLEYELIAYDRDPLTLRAPESLMGPHPLGKAPVIEDNDCVIAESGAIIEYVVETYGGGKLGPAKGDPERAKYLEWLHYAEGSAIFPILVILIGKMTDDISDGMKGFAQFELDKTLAYIQSAVRSGGYLLESGFSAADIQMSYVIEAARMGGMLEGSSDLSGYLSRLEERPAYKRAIDKGGPVALPIG